jgi:protein TonB
VKKTLLITVLLSSVFLVKAQTKPTGVTDLDKVDIKEPVDTTPPEIDYAVEQEPGFPGGLDMFSLYLQRNLRYPPSAVKKRLEGKVFVSFVIEMSGAVTEVKVLRGVSPDIDAEAVRVVSHSPIWKPGIQNGRPVRVHYNVAMNFSLPVDTSVRIK